MGNPSLRLSEVLGLLKQLLFLYSSSTTILCVNEKPILFERLSCNFTIKEVTAELQTLWCKLILTFILN